mmetsp:Transcript_18461/g.26595  ORF Transcript_18461/g.26595 Transcript_18461/m.26595 type:complete len:85 (+) Transcript_18461:1209-1463(+)
MQAVSLQDRIVEADNFVKTFQFSWPMTLDIPEEGDPFLKAFAPWPTRFYIMQNGIMQFIANPRDDHMYDLVELREVLERLISAA